jgi:hypothetical protein
MRTVWRTIDQSGGGLIVRAKVLKNSIAAVSDGADANFRSATFGKPECYPPLYVH